MSNVLAIRLRTQSLSNSQVFMLSIPFRYWMLISTCVQLIMYVALWLLTSRDPQTLHLPNHNTSRRLLRVLLIAYVASFSLLGLRLIDLGIAYLTARLPISGLATIMFACTFIMSIVYIRSLARKIPDDRFSRRVSLILYASIALLILHYSTYPLTMLAATYLGNAQAFTTAVFLHHVSFLAVFIPYFFLVNRTRRELKGVRSRM